MKWKTTVNDDIRETIKLIEQRIGCHCIQTIIVVALPSMQRRRITIVLIDHTCLSLYPNYNRSFITTHAMMSYRDRAYRPHTSRFISNQLFLLVHQNCVGYHSKFTYRHRSQWRVLIRTRRPVLKQWPLCMQLMGVQYTHYQTQSVKFGFEYHHYPYVIHVEIESELATTPEVIRLVTPTGHADKPKIQGATRQCIKLT